MLLASGSRGSASVYLEKQYKEEWESVEIPETLYRKTNGKAIAMYIQMLKEYIRRVTKRRTFTRVPK